MMFDVVQSLFTIFIEMFCHKLFLEAFCPYKSSLHRKRSIFLLAITFIGSSCIIFLIDDMIPKQILLILGLSFISRLFFDSNILKLAALTTIYMGVLLASDFIVYICACQFFAEAYADSNETLAVFIARLLSFSTVLVVRRVRRQAEGANLSNAEWLQLLLFPAFSICAFTLISTNSGLFDPGQNGYLLWLLAFGMLSMNILVFSVMQDISKRELQLRENEIAEVKANNQLALYQSVVDNYDKQNGRLHEYKNQIECLLVLAREESYPELERYLDQIGKHLTYETDAVDTRHAVVNAIVNSKYQEAASNQIIMVLKLADLSGLWLNEHDTVVLLANLLDNAIEACKKVENRRIIKLKMVIEKRFLVLSVSNTYDGSVKSSEGVLLSTKENAVHEHGIGVKNIIRIVEKYGGSYIIDPQRTEFTFSILIPKKKPETIKVQEVKPLKGRRLIG